MKKTLFLTFIFLFTVCLVPFGLLADETTSVDLGETNSKLEQVLTTQQEILKELQDIKSELQVLKIRVSQNQ